VAQDINLRDGSRRYIYPLWVKGQFQRVRKATFVVLNVFFFVMPWLRVDGKQLVLADLPARRLYLFGAVFGPQDTILVVLALLFAAFLLFLVTSLYGRIWCGYACPHTVFLESFVHNVERWIEGNRGKRMALDRQPWNAEKILKKTSKWAAFLVITTVVSMTAVSWFVDAPTLWTMKGGAGAYGMVASLSLLGFLDMAWFREQFCNYLCPYARFQGVLAGPESWTVGYDKRRGEPRKERGRKQAPDALGDCIGCNKCVSVCPTGIDIRDGYQLECIGCAKCIDACEPIMGKFNKDNLIRYSTVARDSGLETKRFPVRPVAYGTLLAVIATAFIVILSQHTVLDVDVRRADGSLYTVDADGATRNTFLMALQNRDSEAVDLTVEVRGLDGAEVIVPPIRLESGATARVPVVVRMPAGSVLERTVPFEVVVSGSDEPLVRDATFKTGAATGG
jgi:cytochrome c oxidase accessory protein FixG